MHPDSHDVAIIGAGAAGMMCAAVAGQRGRRVVLIEHSVHVGEKIRISGGGRCNFTNTQAELKHYIGCHPRFARQTLAGYTPRDFIALVRKHRIGFHEKHKGQLFCDDSSQRIIDMLRGECSQGRVQWMQPAKVHEVRRQGKGFALTTSQGNVHAERLVVATGGLPVPKIGATDYGLRLAQRFGLHVVPPKPALVPLTFAPESWKPYAELAGVAGAVRVRCGEQSFDEDLLFTHRGLSGPAILQISSFWNPGDSLTIDLAPGRDIGVLLRQAKAQSRQSVLNVLAQTLPRRLAQTWVQNLGLAGERRIAELPDAKLAALGAALAGWTVQPTGTEGWRKAEVMRGGVDTAEVHPVTLEARQVPGLHFIGEVLDVTGWLGGYNFQWAWASGYAAGMAV
ncbi:aminoacetone oxidase family FAD-binding enzyme [Thiomonas sp. FB-Cd]|uniref:NAD(P)/FAD-dependent oxidoreductase n=1 Tax=Thiomonas sp. FB-Cd TaxID=1158292 RepID=UPI0004DF5C28|nr:aminoacetone oxidase family FAD-binding enzyme [Thiomonas sp. FB-Cd]